MLKKRSGMREREWSRKWQPTPVFLPGESHGQRSLLGYSLWGRKELDTTEHLNTHMTRERKQPTSISSCHPTPLSLTKERKQ